MSSPARLDRVGLASGVLAYGLWAIIPLFWRLLVEIDPYEVIAHRVVWGCLTFLVMAAAAKKLDAVRAVFRDRRAIAWLVVSGALLAVNWVTFVYSVTSGHLVDASLGYFINPLVSVALGMVVLGERLRPAQWIAVGLACVGVTIATWQRGELPWISLVLALTFGAYGLVRKLARVEALVGSTVETALALPVALAYLALLASRGDGALGHARLSIELLLVATGVVTAVPMLLFTVAALRLPLSIVGFLQYIAPSGQFAIAVLLWHEDLHGRIGAFVWIWAGLAVFAFDACRATRRTA
jgi:chloramphenicol-sensitive protein RarD